MSSGRARRGGTHGVEEPRDVVVGGDKGALAAAAELVEEGEGVHGLVEAAAEAAEEDDGVLLCGVGGVGVSGAHAAYLDVALRALVVDERADALHDVL